MSEQLKYCSYLLKYVRNCNNITPNKKYCLNLQNLYHEFCVEMTETEFTDFQNYWKNKSKDGKINLENNGVQINNGTNE